MSKRIRPEDIPHAVVELCQMLSRRGFRGWVVGGCLRDKLRGAEAADWDLATDARPEQVQAVFPRVIPTGIQHGTVTVRHRGQSFELTTLRGEGAYSDGRRPDHVEFVSDIGDDLGRRDFTINAIAYDPVADRLDDPYGGLDDLERRSIRAVGAPERRFSEDGLRVLRAARFAATLEFELEAATEAAIRPTLETFRRVSAERVRDEWLKALKARQPSRAFAVMRRTGILEITEPELASLDEPRWQATLAAVDALPKDPILRVAALLFPLRDDARGIADWLTRYRFSNAERERVVRVLQYALPTHDGAWTPPEVRRYARRVGRELLDDVCTLSVAIARARSGEADETQAVHALNAQLRELVTPETPLQTRELALTGRDLMTELALVPGPGVGQLLDRLLEHVLDEPARNTREQLLEIARALRASSEKG